MIRVLATLILCTAAATAQSDHPLPDDPRWLRFPGGDGPGAGRHVVFIAADQEYRSEQSLPMLAHLLAERHGFHTTVLFGVNAEGLVDPTQKIRWEDKTVMHDVPGIEYLDSADMLILFTRLITLPKDQLAHLHAYFDSGKPLIALRTANHGFIDLDYKLSGKRVHFGEDVLGGSFRSHHGNWHADSTRGTVIEDQADHPILRGVKDVWGPSDVYRTFPEGGALPEACTPLLMGQPLTGRKPTDGPNPNLIPLPIAWIKTWTGAQGRPSRVFHSTMGSAKDFENSGLRRLIVNATFWGLELEQAITPNLSVDIVGRYAPLASGFAYEKLGVKPRPARDYDPRYPDADTGNEGPDPTNKHALRTDSLPDPDGLPADMGQTVQVYILLGQSNMLGFGKVKGDHGSLELAVQEKGLYPYLVDDEGQWTVREDVRNVRVMGSGTGGMRQFNNEFLTITGGKIGPEIGIGHHLGQAIEAPVMVLKSCIGNRSLGWDLLPPGSEQYEYEGKIYAGYKQTPDSWEKGTEPEPIGWYAGMQYDGDVARAKGALAELDKYYPGAKGYEVAGFFWWQGDKDRYNAAHASKYEENLARLINQLRTDFAAPTAHFVIATLGQTKKGSTGNEGMILDAMLNVDGKTGKHPEFKGNVATVYSYPLSKGGSSNGHYDGNAETYMNIGEAMGRAMANLIENERQKTRHPR